MRQVKANVEAGAQKQPSSFQNTKINVLASDKVSVGSRKQEQSNEDKDGQFLLSIERQLNESIGLMRVYQNLKLDNKRLPSEERAFFEDLDEYLSEDQLY